MFESICVRRQRTIFPAPLDPGLLAELLLFYERVRVIVDRGLLVDLLTKCGPDEVVELVTSGRLAVTYLPNALGIITELTGSPNEIHSPTMFTVPGAFEMQNALPAAFEEVLGKPGRARRLAVRLQPHVEEFSFEESLPTAAIADFTRPEYMAGAVRAALSILAPEYSPPEQMRFEVESRGDFEGRGEYFKVETNLDFVAANGSHHRHFPTEMSTLTSAQLLSHVLNALSELQLAGFYTAELATEPAALALIRYKCASVLAGRDHRADTIAAFQEVVVENGQAIRDVVNSGERTFAEVIELVDSAARFRKWLRNQEPTADLVGEFVRRSTEKTWAERLPTKAARWAVPTAVGFAVAGPVGAAAGAAWSAFDAFLLDRIIGGYRPSQFIDDELRPFLDT